MNIVKQQLGKVFNTTDQGFKSSVATLVESLKVFSIMGLVFLILAITGPLTFAVQHHIGYVF